MPVAGQANLLDKDNQIINGGKALTSDSVSSIFSGWWAQPPAAVYINQRQEPPAGGKTGLTATVVGVLFLMILFLSPLSFLIPGYATAPALMYVGLLMLSNVSKLDFNDFIDAMAGLVCAVFIVLTCNIVTGIMLGFVTLVVGRVFFAREMAKAEYWYGDHYCRTGAFSRVVGQSNRFSAPFSAEISFTEDSHCWQQYAAGGLA